MSEHFSRDRGAGPTARRRRAVVGTLVVSLLGSLFALLPASPANAAPQTEAIPLATLDPAPQDGTLANQVGWSVNVGQWNTGGQGYAFLQSQNPQAWTFDKPVSVRFGIAGLNLGGECVEVPEGSVLETLAGEHTWDPGTRLVCVDIGSASAESVFTHPGPLTTLELAAVGGPGNAGRGPTFIEVTYDVPVASIDGPLPGGEYTEGDGTVLDFTCADGTGELTGTATIDGVPMDDGAPIDQLGPGEHTITVVCVDEHGATHEESVTFTVVAAPVLACPEDGLQLTQPPHMPPGSKPPIVSGTVHGVVEPLIATAADPLLGALGLQLTPVVHELNCELVEPVEDVVDELTIPLVAEVKPVVRNLLRGLFR